MFHDLKAVFQRAQPTLLQDMAGVTALVVMLVAALHLPNLF